MFPDFNLYSTPLLVLVSQGIILSFLLLGKAMKMTNRSYLLLAMLLLITCYHRTTYTIGFMGWYDTFRNSKINYYLISLALATGPLIYLYIRSCVDKNSKFNKKDLLHFIPVLVYVLWNIYIYIYDSQQAGFDDTFNGVLKESLGFKYWTTVTTIHTIQLALYLFLSFRMYSKYRTSLIHHFSNTYKYELKWLRNFLYLFSFLFIYDVLQSITDGFILDLHWTEEWWFQFFSILVVIYLGVKGYFTSTESLPDLSMDLEETNSLEKSRFQNLDKTHYLEELESLKLLMSSEQLFLDPSLSLRSLSQRSGHPPSQLSKIINIAAGQNFNDFVNQYRVELVKERISSPDTAHLSILAIALDAGFNSKATFNRVFKKLAGSSPSSFRK